MKRIILLASCFFALQGNAQETEKKATNDSIGTYNRLTFEAMTGFADGNYPYGNGFTAGDKKHVLSHFTVNNFDLGARYMITPKFGLKANLAYSIFTDQEGLGLPYETNHLTFALQGVINAARILDFKQDSRFGLLGHAGIQVGSLTSKTKDMMDPVLGKVPNPSFDETEYHGGFVAGITPQYRISNKIALFVDLSTYFNYRQHFNWDGTASSRTDLYGKTTNLSVGLSFSIGKDKMHGDYAVIKSENEQKAEALQNELKTKIEDVEVMLQDTDRDGVVDYLDAEPSTTGGVAVDTKGRAIDVNKNGVPDELEPRNGNNGSAGTSNGGDASFDYLVKQGIVNIFFDTNKETPNSASANNLFYIINFLKANPTAKVRARGFADVTGDEKYNQELAQKRAVTTKDFIVKSGISADRIEILGLGEDTSMDTNSNVGRQLARRVSFELVK
jgi:OmpA-OmpF porin, OOP family